MEHFTIAAGDQLLVVPEQASCYSCTQVEDVLEVHDHGMHALTLVPHVDEQTGSICAGPSLWYVTSAPLALNLAWGPGFGPVYRVAGPGAVEVVQPAARGHELGARAVLVDDQLHRTTNLEAVRVDLGAAA